MALPLAEKYRPSTWSDLVGQSKLVATVERLKGRGSLAGRAYFISGPSGAGKTSVARLLAAEVADPFFTEEVDATALTVAALRDMEREMNTSAWGKGGKAYLFNEAHGLRRDVIRQLLVLLERIPPHVLIVFTTTNQGEETLFEECEDASPLLSRCLRLDLARRDLAKAFAERAKWIAEQEGLDGRPVEQYLRLVQKHRQNLRAVIQEIESGAMLD